MQGVQTIEQWLKNYIAGREPLDVDALKVALETTQPEHLHLIAINKTSELGTAIILACRDGHVQVLHQLLPPLKGIADELLLAKDVSKHTALHMAAWRGDDETVRLLLDTSSPERRYWLIAEADACKRTALTVAAARGHIKTVESLLERTSEDERIELMKIEDIFQDTALHCAAFLGHSKTLKLMLDFLPAPSLFSLLLMKNADEKTPLEEAQLWNREKTIKLLKRYQQQAGEGLSEVLAEQATLLEIKDEQIAEQGKQLDEQSRQLDEQRRQLNEQGRQLGGQRRQLDEQGRQLDEQGRQTEEMPIVERLKAHIMSLEKQTNTLLTQMEERLNAQRKLIAEQHKQLESLERRLIAQDKKIDMLQKRLDAPNESSPSLANQQETHINELTNRLSVLQTRMKALEGWLDYNPHELNLAKQLKEWTGCEFSQLSLAEQLKDWHSNVLEKVKAMLAQSAADQKEIDEKIVVISSTIALCVRDLPELQRSSVVVDEQGSLSSALTSLRQQIFELCLLVGVDSCECS